MKLKEYRVNLIRSGSNVNHVVVCKSRKRAAELLNTSLKYITDYGHTLDAPRSVEAIENPESVYGYCDSGLMFEYRKDLLNKLMPINDLEIILNNLYEKKCTDKTP